MNAESSGLDRLGRSALHYAALENDVVRLEKLLSDGCRPNLHDRNGWTPLHFAAQSNSVSCANALIAAGAEIDATDANGNTPLGAAVFNSRGFGDLIRLLRKKGADPDKKNLHGQSPIGLARLIANYDLVSFFDDAEL